MNSHLDIAVLGAGSWGTTLAILLSENQHRIRLWEFFPEKAEKIAAARVNDTRVDPDRLRP